MKYVLLILGKSGEETYHRFNASNREDAVIKSDALIPKGCSQKQDVILFRELFEWQNED